MLTTENESLRVIAAETDGTWYLVFECKDSEGVWHTVLGSGLAPGQRHYGEEKELKCQDPKIQWKTASPEAELQTAEAIFNKGSMDGDGKTIVLSGNAGCHSITQKVLQDSTGHVKIIVEDTITGNSGDVFLSELMSNIYFIPEGKAEGTAAPLDFAWLPALHKKPDHVCSDHFFRSPVAAVYANGYYGAIIPDLDVFAAHRSIPQALDLRLIDGPIIEAPRLSYGICPSVAEEHVYTRHPEGYAEAVSGNSLKYAFDLFFGAADSAKKVTEEISEYLWRRYGHSAFKDIRPQVLPFEEYGRKYTYIHEFPRSIKHATINGKQCTGINNFSRHGANFHAWENDLAVGFGARYYGEKWNDENLVREATGILDLSLSAAGKDGAFPCVYNFAAERYEGSVSWVSRVADYLDGFDTGAMGVSAWLSLYWDEIFDLGPETVKRAEDYARFLAEHMLPSGAVPTYFYADLTAAKQLMESATTGISGAVLAKVARLTGRSDLTAAALTAGKYTVEHIIPTLAFSDFETHYSCSPKPLYAVDYWSGIKGQCNLSNQWCCDQMLALYQLTGDKAWLEHGEHLLQVLSLYQQVWNPSHRTGYLYGGFGVLNTDGEWNDGRQSRFVPTYADYYLATGNIEYLERAVAACRASFALMDIPENHSNDINRLVAGENFGVEGAANGKAEPGMGYSPENLHHMGNEQHDGSWTGMNWGAGGGLGASAYLEARFGNVWVDGAKQSIIPIDGAEAEIEAWADDSISIKISSALKSLSAPYEAEREFIVKFGSLPNLRRDITVNGKTFKDVTKEELESGLTIRI